MRVPCARFSRALSALALFAVLVVLPRISSAQSWVDELVREASQAAEERSGTVIIENHSSVSTGGKVVGSGGSSVSDGNVSASSRSETYINVGTHGGEAKVKVETSRNGISETREYEKNVETGESMHIQVSARADEEGTQVSAISKDASGNGAALAMTASSSKDESVLAPSRFESALKAVPAFFSRVFEFFWHW